MHKCWCVLGLILLPILLNLQAASAEKIVGAKVYENNCSVCHKTGISGAPKVGDKAIWKPIIEQGMDVVFRNVQANKAHPICKRCRAKELKEAIKHMANQSASEGNYVLW